MMNIKILRPIEETEVLATLPFGSQVYGTLNTESDMDFVKILKQDTGSLLLQYQGIEPVYNSEKDITVLTKVDYVYTDTKNFWSKIEDGGNTLFFECLHTPQGRVWLASQGLYPELEVIMDAYTARMAKGYLGLAKRDLPYPDREHHVARSIWMAEKIIKKELINLKDVAAIPPLKMGIPEAANYISHLRSGLKYDQATQAQSSNHIP
jgi:hypothetical protein